MTTPLLVEAIAVRKAEIAYEINVIETTPSQDKEGALFDLSHYLPRLRARLQEVVYLISFYSYEEQSAIEHQYNATLEKISNDNKLRFNYHLDP
ncbi:hypothetical protein CR203_06865 [Salipaludibacillus neizhouensis]|uniref:Uncharacterized protein n=1 Tax=Salipaludibacillus neizhouensis TaxID=885475 RepID=A0A3A9KCD9_9BACI|nr:hypothetical protein [Salipaludibacillus neizhouensis]RKL68202.1 hypothetical protein CR203_06865 [Salipaludibacillus neizhouensis]